MPGIYKIGMTENSASLRAEELYTTGVPTKFNVEAYYSVSSPTSAERYVHTKLKAFRVNHAREFFRIDPYWAEDALLSYIDISGDKVGTDTIYLTSISEETRRHKIRDEITATREWENTRDRVLNLERAEQRRKQAEENRKKAALRKQEQLRLEKRRASAQANEKRRQQENRDRFYELIIKEDNNRIKALNSARKHELDLKNSFNSFSAIKNIINRSSHTQLKKDLEDIINTNIILSGRYLAFIQRIKNDSWSFRLSINLSIDLNDYPEILFSKQEDHKDSASPIQYEKMKSIIELICDTEDYLQHKLGLKKSIAVFIVNDEYKGESHYNNLVTTLKSILPTNFPSTHFIRDIMNSGTRYRYFVKTHNRGNELVQNNFIMRI